MNHDHIDKQGNQGHPDRPDGALPPGLQAGLAALRRDVAPQRDLWPPIAARLAHAPAQDVTCGAAAADAAAASLRERRSARRTARTGPGHARRGSSRLVPWAVAASLLLAVSVGWQLVSRPAGEALPAMAADAAADAPLLRIADAMAREYTGALRELDAARSGAVPTAPAGVLAELDRSADAVRAALEHDPDAVFLLQRLQRIYAQRLSLSRRLA